MEYYGPTTTAPKKRNFSFLKLAASWAVAISIAIALQQFVFQSYQVFGASMEPTLHEGDYLIISKLGPSLANLGRGEYVPERGDIVVFDANSTRLIKRVVGLPGDTVIVSGGQITVVNNDNPDGFDPYEGLDLPEVVASGAIRSQVPRGHIFVVGDNRTGSNSLDSRNQLGTVPTEDVIGSLILRLWPATEARSF